jgi:hypothetical protein
MRTFAAAIVAGVFATSAAAAPAPPEAAALPPKVVAPVTVMPGGAAPKIVSSFPAAGEVIAPGVLVMRITFDQEMEEDGFAFTPAPGGQMPDCLKTPRLLNDQKTFVLLCTTLRQSAYALAFNATPHEGFQNVVGRHAAPAQLAFSTNADEGPHDLDAALKVAKLTSGDVPIATQP